MKALLCAAVVSALCLPAIAEEAKPAPKLEVPAAAKKIDRIETKERYVFTGVEVLEKLPDGIYIRLKEVTTPRTKKEGGKVPERGTFITNGGTTFLPYETLPDAVQKLLGGFVAGDARKAKEKREADRQAGEEGFEADDMFTPYFPGEEQSKVKKAEKK